MDNLDKHSYSLLYIFLFLLFPLEYFPELNSFKAVAFPFLLSFYFILKYQSNSGITIQTVDFIILGISIYYLLSYFWVDHPAAIWNKALAYFGFFLAFCFGKTNPKLFEVQAIPKTIIGVGIFNILVFVSITIRILIEKPAGFNFSEIMLYNKHSIQYGINTLSSLVLLQIPFIYQIQKLGIYSKMSSTILVGMVLFLFLFNSRAATILLVVFFGHQVISSFDSQYVNKGIRLTLVALGIIMGALLLMNDTQHFIQSYNPIRSIDGSSNDDRMAIWNNTFEMIKEYPILGKGSGHWQIEYPKYGLEFMQFSYDTDGQYVHAHNFFLETSAENGIIVGIVFLILFILYPTIKLYRSKSNLAAQLLLLCAGLFCFYGHIYFHNIPIQPIMMLAFISLGHLINNKGKVSRWPIPIIVVLGVFIGLFIADRELRSDKVKHRNDLKTLDQRLDRIDAVLVKDYYEYHDHINLHRIKSEIYAAKKQPKRSENAMRNALYLQPYSPFMLYTAARKQIRIKKYKAAKKNLVKALRINPNHFKSRILLTRVLLIMGNQKQFEVQYQMVYDEIDYRISNHYTPERYDQAGKQERAYLNRMCRYYDELLEIGDGKIN